MEELLKQIGQKALDCPTNTKESRARKGAYVDCIMMIKEALRKHDVSGSFDHEIIEKVRKSSSDAEARRYLQQHIQNCH